jgi:hypothetical protein
VPNGDILSTLYSIAHSPVSISEANPIFFLFPLLGFPCNDEIKAQSKLASDCYKNLENLVSKKAIENCMKSFIDEIVVDILMMTHDSNDGAGDADFIR